MNMNLQTQNRAMRDFDFLKDIVDKQLMLAGYSVDVEEYSNGFGSYYIVYSHKNHQVRFVYDGRDNLAFIEHSKTGTRTWEQISYPIAASNKEEMARLAETDWLPKLVTIVEQ